MSSLLSPCFNCHIFVCSLQETQNLNNFRKLVQLWLSSLWWVTQQLLSKSSWKIHLHLVCISLFLLKLNSSSLVAHNHEHLERSHSICLASHQRIIAAIEFPSAAHELLFSPHIFVWGSQHGRLELGSSLGLVRLMMFYSTVHPASAIWYEKTVISDWLFLFWKATCITFWVKKTQFLVEQPLLGWRQRRHISEIFLTCWYSKSFVAGYGSSSFVLIVSMITI